MEELCHDLVNGLSFACCEVITLNQRWIIISCLIHPTLNRNLIIQISVFEKVICESAISAGLSVCRGATQITIMATSHSWGEACWKALEGHSLTTPQLNPYLCIMQEKCKQLLHSFRVLVYNIFYDFLIQWELYRLSYNRSNYERKHMGPFNGKPDQIDTLIQLHCMCLRHLYEDKSVFM